MNQNEPRSGRRSGRVVDGPPKPDVTAGPNPITAPERLSSPTPVTAGQRAAPERIRRRAGRRQLAVMRSDLGTRDLAILGSLDQHRFLTTRQVEVLHFHDHASDLAAARICRRTLARLAELRVIEHLQRRVGGVRAGSASFVWRVGPVGDRLLRQASGDGVKARRKEPSLRFLDHCLAIANCHIALVVAGRAHRVELLDVALEPNSWRSYLGASGQRELLKPDMYAITASGDYEDHWFIEIDRGTESLPTVVRKCTQYERYRRTGTEQQQGGVFPLVVWAVPDQPRADKLRAAIRAARGLDTDLYRITTSDRLLDAITGETA